MEYKEFKEAVIRIAAKMQIAEYELYYEESESASVEIYQEEVKGYGTENRMGVGLRCIVDGKAGYASTENLTEEEAASLIARALDNARSIESEEKSFLHEKGDVYAAGAEMDETVPTGTELMDMALGVQKEMYQADSRVSDGTQTYTTYTRGCCALYNSNGLDLEDRTAYGVCLGMALVAEGGELYDGSKRKTGRLQDFDIRDIAAEAVEDAVSTIGAGSVPSGKYTVVFSNKAMATLLQTYSDIFSAEQAQKGMSLLAGKEGEEIAADIVTIVDDPRHEDGIIKRTFDGEGVAAYAKNVVEKGVLSTLLHNLKTAANAGVKTTGNASRASYASVVGVSPFTFYIQPGQEPDLLAAAGDGIYVTEMMGLHAGANPVTGDFSLSSAGFLIADGKKSAPVKNFTVSGNFFTLLKEIEKVGADLEFIRGKYGSPSVLVRNLAVAGK
ncbi:MAG: TldD/PmbA family protein [Lachnospiraceae bacterium]|nr:TldD/PmbA family protein [Lachnospiraceae bacterium]